MKGNLYSEDSIKSLSPLEFTRLRPGVYAGSTEYSTQLLIEIVSNVIDEWKAGHGNQVDISIEEDNSIQVKDYAQGFLVNSIREDGKTVLQAAFDTLNTSGKYTEDGVYEGTALGLNGIGSKLVNFLSHELEVLTVRDGKFEKIWFKEGVFENRETGIWTISSKNKSGTCVKWLPSEEFFTHVEIEESVIDKLFQVLACLCPGLTINFNNKGKQKTYFSNNGLNDLVDQEIKNEILKNRLNIKYSQDKYKLDLILTYTDNYSTNIIPYVNTGLTDSGPHITQIKTILTRELNKFFRSKGWLKEKEDNLTGDDCQEGLFLVFNITSSGVSYDAQTKSRVVKLDMKPFTQILTEELQYWMAANEKDIKQIVDKALSARKARDAARGLKEKKDKTITFDSKLADCYSRDRSKCEIYVTEGDSASGNLKNARNNEFQAVLPLRGKILNTHRANLDKIQKNAEIMSMIQSFGLTIDVKTMKVTYNPKELRYGKIIIMSDSDVDGEHIKNLFYTFIWNFCPQLILDGYVYAGVPPLYRITMNKKYIYIKDNEELEVFKNNHPNSKYEVNYFKGLGEMDVDETEDTLINPNNRIIRQVTVADIELANKLFDDLMGTSSVARKEYIVAHAKEAKYDY